MKINPKYRLRKVGGKSLIISQNTLNFEGVPTLNDTGEFIWHMLEKGAETQEIISALAKECSVSENEVRDDVEDFISALKSGKIIE